MAKLTATQADILDKMEPESQQVALGAQVKELGDNGIFGLVASITTDASVTAKTITVPFACEVIDVVVQARATSGGGTATVRKVTTAITNAIAMATDLAITRAGTIDDAQSTLAAGDNLNVITNGAADRGLVTVIVRQV